MNDSHEIKPLKILTIDGGGLQAVSTLLILNELLERIAERNGVDEKPKPCEVFDTIAGIGAGGWLAIMLGRFQMDITSCLNEWYKMTQRITPRSTRERFRLRLFKHCYFDTDRLLEQSEHLTKIYGTGENLYQTDLKGARTRHVFVAALKSDGQGYNLFRSYPIPTSAYPERLLEGPENPDTFKISSAFGVTGAARYFAPKWKEQMENSGKTRFRDNKFPNPHNITELALDEMWAIYGTGVRISTIVNIGPGLPNGVDVKQIARRFSWGPEISRPSRSRQGSQTSGLKSKVLDRPASPVNRAGNSASNAKRNSVHFDPTLKPDPDCDPSAGNEHHLSQARTNTFGSVKGREFDSKLRRLEEDIEEDIQGKLANVYSGNERRYYRLALSKAPEGTTQNDSAASRITLDATRRYLGQDHTRMTMDTVAQLLSLEVDQKLPSPSAIAVSA